MTHTLLVVWGGFMIGAVFGAVGQRIEFCLAGSLREWLLERQARRGAAFLVAAAVALAGTQIAAQLSLVDLRASIYLQGSFSWLLIPLGGFLFGYGMILARGCGARALVLLAEGNLRSLLVLLCLGIAAHAALTGIVAPARVAASAATLVAPALPSLTLPGLLAAAGGDPAGWALPVLTATLAAGVLAYTRVRLRLPLRDAAGAGIIGLLVPAGWIITGHLGADDFDPVPVASLTFVAPIGDALQYLMLATGIPLGFGAAVVGGVLLGSLIACFFSRSFELRGFESNRQVVHAIGGGILMGVGGALALGCSIGQGLTGLSTLALPSFLAVGGILLGSYAALRTERS